MGEVSGGPKKMTSGPRVKDPGISVIGTESPGRKAFLGRFG